MIDPKTNRRIKQRTPWTPNRDHLEAVNKAYYADIEVTFETVVDLDYNGSVLQYETNKPEDTTNVATNSIPDFSSSFIPKPKHTIPTLQSTSVDKLDNELAPCSIMLSASNLESLFG